MISYKGFLKSFCFPCAILDLDSNVIEFQEHGALFKLPEDDFSIAMLLEHIKSCQLGWSTCPNGYACYAKHVSQLNGLKFVTFGLKVQDVSTVKGRRGGLSIKTEKNDVIDLVEKFFDSYSEVEESFKGFINSNLHEVRQINADIYHTAYELDANKRLSDKQREYKYKDITTLTGVLSERLNYLEFLSNPVIIESAPKAISDPFKAFDKVRRSLHTTAKNKRIDINIEGDIKKVVGKIRATQLFSVIPYLLLENAIKYSPKKRNIDISFQEDESKIFVAVSSFGPKLDEGEEKKIFKNGYRGSFAKSFETGGSGMGLFALKRLVEFQDGGLVYAKQDKDMSYQSGNMLYYRTTFHLEFNRIE